MAFNVTYRLITNQWQFGSVRCEKGAKDQNLFLTFGDLTTDFLWMSLYERQDQTKSDYVIPDKLEDVEVSARPLLQDSLLYGKDGCLKTFLFYYRII